MTVRAARLFWAILSVVSCLFFPGGGSAAAPADSDRRAVEEATELFRAGEIDAAIVALRKTTESGSSSAEAYHLLGQMYFKGKKKPQDAVEAYTHALKLKPAYPDALNDLAEDLPRGILLYQPQVDHLAQRLVVAVLDEVRCEDKSEASQG